MNTSEDKAPVVYSGVFDPHGSRQIIVGGHLDCMGIK